MLIALCIGLVLWVVVATAAWRVEVSDHKDSIRYWREESEHEVRARNEAQRLASRLSVAGDEVVALKQQLADVTADYETLKAKLAEVAGWAGIEI